MESEIRYSIERQAQEQRASSHKRIIEIALRINHYNDVETSVRRSFRGVSWGNSIKNYWRVQKEYKVRNLHHHYSISVSSLWFTGVPGQEEE